MQKLYVLIRKDLGAAYGAVQAGHAVAEWLLQHGQSSEWQNGTLIYLSVENEEELNHWIFKMDKRNMEWTGFREPDMGNQMTAIACLTDTNMFDKLKLWGE